MRTLIAGTVAFLLALVADFAAHAQVQPVYRQVQSGPGAGNATQQQLITVPSGMSITLQSGATLTCQAGATCTGGTATSVPLSGITGLGAGVATFLGTPTSANLAAAVTDETGSGGLVFATAPSLVTPALGAATGTSLALGGATLGGNALAVTGSANISGSISGGANITATGVFVTADGRFLQPSGTILDFRTFNTAKFFQTDGTTPAASFFGTTTVNAPTALTSGGSTAMCYLLSSSSIGYCAGTGVPTISMAKGSVYTDNAAGALYVNNNGTTGWSSIPTTGPLMCVTWTAGGTTVTRNTGISATISRTAAGDYTVTTSSALPTAATWTYGMYTGGVSAVSMRMAATAPTTTTGRFQSLDITGSLIDAVTYFACAS